MSKKAVLGAIGSAVLGAAALAILEILPHQQIQIIAQMLTTVQMLMTAQTLMTLPAMLLRERQSQTQLPL